MKKPVLPNCNVRTTKEEQTLTLSHFGIRYKKMKRYGNCCFSLVVLTLLTIVFVGCSNKKKTSEDKLSQGNEIATTNAMDSIIHAAQAGDKDAQYDLGNHYFSGDGVGTNYTEAVKWFRLSAMQGFAPAQHNLGWMYAKGAGVAQDYREALQWYLKSAKQGYPMAQHKVGLAFTYGEGVVRDDIEAVKWFRRAADQGDAFGEIGLGRSYENGFGVPQNDKEAFKWYFKGAQQGETPGQFFVAEYYRTGTGIQNDPVEAYKWYSLVASKSDEDGWAKKAVAALDQLRLQLTSEQIHDAEQRVRTFVASQPRPEAPTENTDLILLDDPSKRFVIWINRILIGQRAADEGRYYQSSLDGLHSRKKEIVYFEITIENIDGGEDHNLSMSAFTLEDSDRNSYSCEQTKDYITGKVQLGRKATGGIAFAVNNGSIPKRLIFDTGYIAFLTHEKCFAVMDTLDKLAIFKEPVGQDSR